MRDNSGQINAKKKLNTTHCLSLEEHPSCVLILSFCAITLLTQFNFQLSLKQCFLLSHKYINKASFHRTLMHLEQ